MSLEPILHTVSYSGSWGQASLNVEQSIDKAAALGFRGILLMAKRPHVSILDYDADARARLKRHIEASGLREVAIAGYNNFTADLEHGEVPHLEIQVQYIGELARLARDLGGRLVRVFTGYQHPGAAYLRQWDMIVAALKECAHRAADYGVILGVQNHHDLAVGYESMHDLIEAVGDPNCRAMFDAWAPALQGENLEAAARRMGPLTVHTTIANYQRRPRYRYEPAVVNYTAETPYAQAVPIDEGFIDYETFLSALCESGFTGTIAYEMCSPLLGGGSMENLDRYSRRFVEFIGEFARRHTAVAALR